MRTSTSRSQLSLDPYVVDRPSVVLMLARLGLRAGEVVRLGLDDIDWHGGELHVVGKGNRGENLPLPADVGAAIAAYLRRGRPASAEGRSAFVRVHAPQRALTAGGVGDIVNAAGTRAGLGHVHAHQLRHSAATAMLRAGTPLAEVGQVWSPEEPVGRIDRTVLRTQPLHVLAEPTDRASPPDPLRQDRRGHVRCLRQQRTDPRLEHRERPRPRGALILRRRLGVHRLD